MTEPHDGGALRPSPETGGTGGRDTGRGGGAASTGIPALDALGWPVGGDVARVTRSVLDGRPVDLDNPRGVPMPDLPEHVVPGLQDAAGRIVVTEMDPQIVLAHASAPTVVLSPPTLVVGVGCRRGTDAAELRTHLDRVLAEQLLAVASVAALVSVDAKADEPGLTELAADLGVPVVTFAADVLDRQDVATPSRVVGEAVDTRSVAEAAVLAAGADLVVPKHTTAASTIAIGRTTIGHPTVVDSAPGTAGAGEVTAPDRSRAHLQDTTGEQA